MSETQRISWDEVLDKNVIEFLNVLAYAKDRAIWRKNSMDEANRKINRIR